MKINFIFLLLLFNINVFGNIPLQQINLIQGFKPEKIQKHTQYKNLCKMHQLKSNDSKLKSLLFKINKGLKNYQRCLSGKFITRKDKDLIVLYDSLEGETPCSFLFIQNYKNEKRKFYIFTIKKAQSCIIKKFSKENFRQIYGSNHYKRFMCDIKSPNDSFFILGEGGENTMVFSMDSSSMSLKRTPCYKGVD